MVRLHTTGLLARGRMLVLWLRFAKARTRRVDLPPKKPRRASRDRCETAITVHDRVSSRKELELFFVVFSFGALDSFDWLYRVVS